MILSLSNTFKISKSANGGFRYLGINVGQNKEAVHIDRSAYVNDMQQIERSLQEDELLSKSEIKTLRSVTG